MKRIFMLSGQLMFSEGVELMLQDRSGYEIVGRETDVAKAIERILDLQPDIIIIDCANQDLLAATTVARIMNQAPNTKIIALNLTDNQIRLYKSEQRTARSSTDLLKALENGVSEGEK